jgi:hypothetical protein
VGSLTVAIAAAQYQFVHPPEQHREASPPNAVNFTSTTIPVFSDMNTAPAERPLHRRNKSASMLKSMMPSSHKRTPTDNSAPSLSQLKENSLHSNPFQTQNTPILPPNHPHSSQRILGEIDDNNTPSRRTQGASPERPKSLHKKTLSTISIRSAGKSKDSSDEEKSRPRSRSARPPKEKTKDKEAVGTPKKAKSSTSLTAVFAKSSRSRSPKKNVDHENIGRDKENTTPPGSANVAPHTPIWAQFSSGTPQESSTTTKIPLNDRKKAIAQEMKLYLPKEYSPSKQRSFFGAEVPTLGGMRERPKSEVLSAGVSSTSVFETLTRKTSNEKTANRPKSVVGMPQKSSDEREGRPAESQNSTTYSKSTPTTIAKQSVVAAAKKGSRVMAAVAVFNSKAKEADADPKMDSKQIDVAFEAVLVSVSIFQCPSLQY